MLTWTIAGDTFWWQRIGVRALRSKVMEGRDGLTGSWFLLR